MDKRGNSLNIVGKILLVIVLLLTLIWGANGILAGIFLKSFTYFFTNSLDLSRIIYTVTGIATIITVIWLFIKVFVKKE